MLRSTARVVARTTQISIPRTFSRMMSSLTIDNSPKEVTLEDLPRLNPAEFFKGLDDNAVRVQLSKLREIENELVSQMSTKEEPLDWAHWQSDVHFPGLVDELKEIHENIPVPNVEEEKKRLAMETEETFGPIIKEFTRLAEEAEEEMVALEKRAADVTYLRDNVRDLTVDEFLEKYPTVKASIEDDIANNRWFVSQ